MEVENRLERLAKETGRTKTFHATQATQAIQAILKKIAELKDYYLAEKAHQDYLASLTSPRTTRS